MSKPPPPPLQLGMPTASAHSDLSSSTPTPSASSHPRDSHPAAGGGANGTSHHHTAGSSSNGVAPANPPPASSSSAPAPPSLSSSSTSTSSSPGSAPPAAPAAAAAYPALHLTPLNGTFVPKQISLDHAAAGRVKIGRQINAKTVPNATNGYFDSKVLSRAHAEVWSEDGKVFIKDVKSSNGTFINGERLSPESTESDVFELHTDDIVEFGIDILTDDTKQIVHHKVAAKVHLVLNAEDAIASHREINNWYRSAGEQSLNRSRAGGPPPRASGGLPSSQSGLSFEHVLSRLQGELQKSRDTGVNLTDVNSTLTVVHETFSGGPAPSLPPGAGIPRAFSNPRNGQQAQQQQQQQQQAAQQQAAAAAAAMAANEAHAQSIAALQAQLNETQASLQGHVGKIRELEGLLAEHDTIKREVGSLRSQIESAQESMSALMRERQHPAGTGSRSAAAAVTNGRESPLARMLEADDEDDDDDDQGGRAAVRDSQDRHQVVAAHDDNVDAATAADDDDDASSIVSIETVVAGVTSHEDGRGPSPLGDDDDAPTSTPPPSSTPALLDEDDGAAREQQQHGGAATGALSDTRERLLEEQNGKLVARLEALSLELSEATRLGATLRTRHAEASETIKLLEQRVAALELAVDRRVAEAEGEILAKAEQSWTGWRERFEHSWREERRTWEGERDALARLVKEWEERKRLEAVAAAAAEEEDKAAAVGGGSAAAAAARAPGEADDDDEEGSGSSSGSSDEGAGVDARSSLSSSLSPGPTGGSPSRNSTTTKKSRSSRRRKRSSLTPVPPSVSGTAASARLSHLARHVIDAGSAGGAGGVASDSDSTIGEQLGVRGERFGAGAGGSGDGASGRAELEDSVGRAASSASSSQDVNRGGAGGKSGEHGGLPLSVAGAVVVLAVAVGYGAAMKLKE
ncbi:hypothetical protein JCM3774_000190 [Rhodotorula dairenensis]